MKKILFALLLALPGIASAQHLVGDPVNPSQGAYTISHCTFTRGTTATNWPVETVTGGVRCNIDVTSDSKTGTVTVNYRDNVLGVAGPTVSFNFGALPSPTGLKLIP